MEFEIEEDVEAASGNLSHEFGPGGGEQLASDFHCACGRVELCDQRKRRRIAVEIERDDNARLIRGRDHA